MSSGIYKAFEHKMLQCNWIVPFSYIQDLYVKKLIIQSLRGCHLGMVNSREEHLLSPYKGKPGTVPCTHLNIKASKVLGGHCGQPLTCFCPRWLIQACPSNTTAPCQQLAQQWTYDPVWSPQFRGESAGPPGRDEDPCMWFGHHATWSSSGAVTPADLLHFLMV